MTIGCSIDPASLYACIISGVIYTSQAHHHPLVTSSMALAPLTDTGTCSGTSQLFLDRSGFNEQNLRFDQDKFRLFSIFDQAHIDPKGQQI